MPILERQDEAAQQEQQQMQAQQALAAPLATMGLNTPQQLVGLINLLHGTQRVVNNVMQDPPAQIRNAMYQAIGLNPQGMQHLGNVASSAVNSSLLPMIRERVRQNLAPQNNADTEAMLQYIAQLSNGPTLTAGPARVLPELVPGPAQVIPNNRQKPGQLKLTRD